MHVYIHIYKYIVRPNMYVCMPTRMYVIYIHTNVYKYTAVHIAKKG